MKLVLALVSLLSLSAFAARDSEFSHDKKPEHKLICVNKNSKSDKREYKSSGEVCSVTGKPQKAEKPAPGDARRM